MPIRFEVDTRAGFVRSTFSGRITAEEVAAHCRRVREAGMHRRPGLVDVRAIEIEVVMTDLLRIARLVAAELSDYRVAPRAVVVGGRRHFESARIMAGLLAGWLSVGVFTDLHEAERWLEHGARQAALVTQRVSPV